MPATTRSTALSKSAWIRWRRCPRAAKIAASLQRFARSAPARPDGLARDQLQVDVRARAACRACGRAGSPRGRRRRAATRGSGGRSGRGAAARGRASRAGWTRRSRRGRPVELKPSISTSSWLSVCSRSELLSVPRCAPTASSSSMKMIAGLRLARLVEQPPDAGGAEAGEHLDERRRRLGEELRAGLVRRPPWPAASCRCRAGRGAGSPSGPWRRARRSASGRAGTRRPRAARPWPRRAPATSPHVDRGSDSGLICCGLVRGISLQRPPDEERRAGP